MSTLSSHFYGKNTYLNPSALVSNFRVGFAELSPQKTEYYQCRNEDTFSVSGVWYRCDTKKYIQQAPLKFVSPECIELTVIFRAKKIYVIQNGMVHTELSARNHKN